MILPLVNLESFSEGALSNPNSQTVTSCVKFEYSDLFKWIGTFVYRSHIRLVINNNILYPVVKSVSQVTSQNKYFQIIAAMLLIVRLLLLKLLLLLPEIGTKSTVLVK